MTSPLIPLEVLTPHTRAPHSLCLKQHLESHALCLVLQACQPSQGGASIKCSTIRAHHATLIGDAAHACTPNMGAGAASALEDAVLLSEACHPYPCYFVRIFDRSQYCAELVADMTE